MKLEKYLPVNSSKPKKSFQHIKKALKYIGKRFNRLVILDLTEQRTVDGRFKVKCICDCGVEIIAALPTILCGDKQSCGCLLVETGRRNVKRAQIFQPKEVSVVGSIKSVYCRYKIDGITLEEFYWLSQQDCFYCGALPNTTYNKYNENYAKKFPLSTRPLDGYFTYNGLDRIDSNFGHTKDNIVTCCVTCNKAKNVMSIEEFLAWVKQIYLFNFKDGEEHHVIDRKSRFNVESAPLPYAPRK